MSDSKKIPTPDDFSKTTPNINLPKDSSSQNSWEKTNYNFPAQPPADDWGNTVANIRPIETDENDFGKTYFPSSQKTPQSPEWGMTQANIDLSETDFGGKQNNYGSRQEESADAGYGVTTPYFRLPEAERAKYQNLPPTPTEKAASEEKEKKEKGGIPGWVWISGSLFSMFFFAVVVLLIVYIFVIRDTGFEATITNAPPGSRIMVDNSQWNVTSDDGSYKLPTLKAGDRTVEIIHPSYECIPIKVTGKDGVNPEPYRASCKAIPVKAGEDCTNIKRGEEDKAERCYNAALAKLDDPPSVEDLIAALNILVINFESNKFDIPPVRRASLQKGAEYIKKLPPTVVLEVGGHTDSQGGDAPNQILSENRANAVKNELEKFGVKAGVLQTKGYGKSSPKTTNETDDGRFQNRRIEYKVLKK
ncbi:MAG: OmpA family protein [Acidobacteriota bacterium]|nr:OmpA family protein [Acidobacteriota bacterium]